MTLDLNIYVLLYHSTVENKFQMLMYQVGSLIVINMVLKATFHFFFKCIVSYKHDMQ